MPYDALRARQNENRNRKDDESRGEQVVNLDILATV
jgi:hypothetical protein